jgi:hypothetical protein
MTEKLSSAEIIKFRENEGTMPFAAPLMKYKLRQLRKVEQAIRFKSQPGDPAHKLVWDVFFSTKPGATHVKYPLRKLVDMSEAEYKSVIEEFFFRIYFQSYQENGLTIGDVYEPQLLEALGLPPFAGLHDVKRRFRELARQYHPDHGGDAEKFIDLMETFNQITGGKK